eukprot:TRINITY_DN1027_c1_g1_i2.p1 TRINITY_DN1027_c1_g1~~TRINITY_DN1027_c1_g1_i2.p1  ORF type:complete len:563 (+),score=102.88 TRINITY_DN1027_c1_g1_i2:65-1753(+)
MTPDIKRPKVEKDIDGVFNETIVKQGKDLGKQHDEGTPYKHVALQGLMEDSFLRKVVAESKEHLEATFKETDLFKMYQTLDLANFVECEDEAIMELRKKVPGIIKLRDALYSDKFRKFVQEACNVKEKLTSRVDMALQAYSNGGHLLCHDDVIGTRAVSFIIYLTDPDIEWTEDMGGELELYPHEKNIPSAIPTKKVLPTSNSMIMFRVQPGVTYHSVSETRTDEIPRLSLQGWFHADSPPEGAEQISSLAMLKVDDSVNHGCSLPDFTPLPQNSVVPSGSQHDLKILSEFLSEQEFSFLSTVLSTEYLTDDSVARIRQQFAKDGSVQLRNFLKKEVATNVLTQCKSFDSEEGFPGNSDCSLGEKSKSVGGVLLAPPVVRRYIQYPIDAENELQISNLASKLLDSTAWPKYLSLVTSLRPLAGRHEVRRFRPGCDYTVGYHKMLEADTRLDVSLCFAPESEGWATGDIGGFECFIESEDSQQIAAEVYGTADDAENDLLSFHACNNTLTLVARDEHMMKFVKYVSAAAPGSRWDIASVFQIDCDGSDTEDEEMEEGCEELEE